MTTTNQPSAAVVKKHQTLVKIATELCQGVHFEVTRLLPRPRLMPSRIIAFIVVPALPMIRRRSFASIIRGPLVARLARSTFFDGFLDSDP